MEIWGLKIVIDTSDPFFSAPTLQTAKTLIYRLLAVGYSQKSFSGQILVHHLSCFCFFYPNIQNCVIIWLVKGSITLICGRMENHEAHHMLAIIYFFSFSLQYYEMSYGLNIEMHKQVCIIFFLIVFNSIDISVCQGKIKGRERSITTAELQLCHHFNILFSGIIQVIMLWFDSVFW